MSFNLLSLSSFSKLLSKLLSVLIYFALHSQVSCEITTSPCDTEVTVGEKVVLNCTSSFGSLEWHHWQVGATTHEVVYTDGNIFNGYKERFSVKSGKYGEYNLQIKDVQSKDAGKYTCMESSEAALQKEAELTVFERYPSSSFCKAYIIYDNWTLSLSCDMKYSSNLVPVMEWVDTSGRVVESTTRRDSDITTSAVQIKWEQAKSSLPTCRIKYQSNSITSNYSWSLHLPVTDGGKISANDPPSQTSNKLVALVAIVLVVVLVILVVVIKPTLYNFSKICLKKRRRNNNKTDCETEEEEKLNPEAESNIHPPKTELETSVSGMEVHKIIMDALKFETEKAEKAEREKNRHNIIIVGLEPVEGKNDCDLLKEFCQTNLNVKIHLDPDNCRRISKPANGQPGKLRVTLESEDVVNELIVSSHILCQSDNDLIKRVYFNRDLTKIQAQKEYEKRLKRRETKTHRVSDHGLATNVD